MTTTEQDASTQHHRPLVAILGGGQLGRMLALAGANLGIRTRVLDPQAEACAGEVAELVVAPFDDCDALRRLVDGADVLTWEFESVPQEAIDFCTELVPVRPGSASLSASRDRLIERDHLESAGFRTPEYRPVASTGDIERALDEIGLPAVLKARTGGYDGKGQSIIRERRQIAEAWRSIGERPALVEQLVAFDREIALLGVRSLDGEVRLYPPIESVHTGGILTEARAPADGLRPKALDRAIDAAEKLVESLEHVGTFAVELFDIGNDLLANEVAMRVHNTGHWTIEAASTSQFENHLRAILGLPLGRVKAHRPTRMLNLIGTVPPLDMLASVPDAHAHIYGKRAQAGRKLGHVTIIARNEDKLDERARRVHHLISESRRAVDGVPVEGVS